MWAPRTEANMRAIASVSAGVLLVSTSLLAQTPSTSPSCAASDQALRVVVHDFWAAFNHGDAAALAKLLDNRLVWVSESGNLLSKAQVLAPFRIPQGSMKLESAEEPENIRTAFVDNIAIISFTKAFKITHQPTGASFGATARMTETFVCAGGEWKVVAFQETMVQNPARQVYKPAADYFDDYVGKYRFGEDGRGGDISVTRQGNRLYESWGTDKPVEILPRGRATVLAKTAGRCHICGGEVFERWQADHVLAHAGGGQHAVDNYLPAHALCNGYRWAYSPEEFQWVLKIGVWARLQMERHSAFDEAMLRGFFDYDRRREARRVPVQPPPSSSKTSNRIGKPRRPG
jgi:Domain of unknown function (DUF4440)